MKYLNKTIVSILYIILFVSLSSMPAIASNYIDSLFTTLVVMDEQENGMVTADTTPFADGVYDALWESDYIFFDMRIKKPLGMVYNQLDIKPFIQTARESGADSVLLIQFHYDSKKEGSNYRLHADEVVFHLYSLNLMKSIRVGRHKVDFDMSINPKAKLRTLRKIGYEALKDIYR
jgi:hypothetical protein